MEHEIFQAVVNDGSFLANIARDVSGALGLSQPNTVLFHCALVIVRYLYGRLSHVILSLQR